MKRFPAQTWSGRHRPQRVRGGIAVVSGAAVDRIGLRRIAGRVPYRRRRRPPIRSIRSWFWTCRSDPDEPEIPKDPVLKTAVPVWPTPHDADAASDFRRFTERDLKSALGVNDAQQVLTRGSPSKRGLGTRDEDSSGC